MPPTAQSAVQAANWRSFTLAWQALPDNPLWVMRQRQQANADPVRRRAVRSRLLLWGGVGLLIWATVLWVISGVSFASTTAAQWAADVIYFIAGPAVIALLYIVVQLTQRAQAWLALDPADAKRTTAALFDPLLGMTPLSPAEVVAAAVRDLAPLILLGSGLAAVTTLLIIIGSRMATDASWGSDAFDRLMTAFVFSPLTLASLLLVGCLGGTIFMLAFFCLGLGKHSPAQRSGWTFAAVVHQVVALPLSFGYLPETDYKDEVWKVLSLVAIALALTAGVLALATQLAFRGRRIAPGWLPGLPGGLAIIGISTLILIGVMGFGGYSSHEDFALATMFQCTTWWASVSLASPGCVPVLQCYGELLESDRAEQWLTSLNFGVTVVVQLCLLIGAYRCALFCAARRLRAGE